MKSMDTFNMDGQMTFNVDIPSRSMSAKKPITINNMDKIMHANKIFSNSEIDRFNKFNRYGWIDYQGQDTTTKEFIFFTKPDLYIYDAEDGSSLNPDLLNIPYFKDVTTRCPKAIMQLQYGVAENGYNNPFIPILSNCVTSKMDVPTISAKSLESTTNIYGTHIDYRSNSSPSDGGYDFTLSFNDSSSLDIYYMVKTYDEYIRNSRMGFITYDSSYRLGSRYKSYIVNHELPELFSVYKFIVGSDGETIIFFAKATGVSFMDVPRGDFSDLGDSGIKYSLSFHAFSIEDSNISILNEFNAISPAGDGDYISVFDPDTIINNEWAAFPKIVRTADATNDKRVARRNVNRDYRLKWTNTIGSQGSTSIPYDIISEGS